MESYLVFCGCLLFAGMIEAGSMGSECGLDCVPKHPQQHYCEADFVIRGTVLNRNYTTRDGMPDMGTGMEGDMPFNYYVVYKVQVEKVYKGASYFSEGMDVYIKTEADNNMCGIGNLMNRKSYMISGQKEEGIMLNINGCNWVAEYKKLTQAQKTGVKRQYGANCNSCQVNFKCVTTIMALAIVKAVNNNNCILSSSNNSLSITKFI
ncbi:metalloproteinase inhibitor 3-like [Anneissia japonica]|uniref:metalloproteinase inhibitor 3-like n=1 Tax=Anneissia japonica TaxID=1529436 RepID=UPI0014259460|nr:metalloproteinase inhibitor 3-like [Anneissia japonica]